MRKGKGGQILTVRLGEIVLNSIRYLANELISK
jgi:hypothetical protein